MSVTVRDIRPSAPESQEMLVRVASCRNTSSRKVSFASFASVNFPLGSEMLRQFRGKRGDAKFFSHRRKSTRGENARFYILLNIIAVIEKRVSAGEVTRRWQTRFSLPRIRVKQVMTGISSLLPRRAQCLGAHSIAPLSPPCRVAFVPDVENVAWNGLTFELSVVISLTI